MHHFHHMQVFITFIRILYASSNNGSFKAKDLAGPDPSAVNFELSCLDDRLHPAY